MKKQERGVGKEEGMKGGRKKGRLGVGERERAQRKRGGKGSKEDISTSFSIISSHKSVETIHHCWLPLSLTLKIHNNCIQVKET